MQEKKEANKQKKQLVIKPVCHLFHSHMGHSPAWPTSEETHMPGWLKEHAIRQRTKRRKIQPCVHLKAQDYFTTYKHTYVHTAAKLFTPQNAFIVLIALTEVINHNLFPVTHTCTHTHRYPLIAFNILDGAETWSVLPSTYRSPSQADLIAAGNNFFLNTSW